ncbi:MAG TPA: right-handed parallel beta-helix repeat-containing protein [Paludibacter sp.]|nr:right-handed parallel beta-helix repeat-containing protein [Paludibacter sp.]
MNFKDIFKNKANLVPLQGLGVLFILFSSFDIYVSPSGNDLNIGTSASPKGTVSAALRQAREMRRLNVDGIEKGINIILKGGTYSFYESLLVRPEDSGTPQSPTIICAAENEKVIISGGVKITGWKKSGKLLVADVPEFNGQPLDFRQLWVNGKKAVRARDVADFDKMNRIIRNDKVNQTLWVPAKAVKSILNAPYPEMVLHQMWVVSNLRIKSIHIQGDSAAVRFHNPESKLQFERFWPRPMIGEGVNSPFYLTNTMELLDQPGEWYHDIRTHKLYYYPKSQEKIDEAIVPAIETLVKVEGTLDRPVENIHFKNITFSHTTWMRPSEKGHVPLQVGMYATEAYRLDPQIVRGDNNHKLDNQVWLERPPASVLVKCSNSINFENCNFKQLGYSGLDYSFGNQGGKVQNCTFSDIVGNGILIGSVSPPAHEIHIPYIPRDEREICNGQQIINNLITDVTNEDWGCVGICAGYVSNINIEHNDISEVSYMGISLGWGWNQTFNRMHNNRVFANHIWHYAKHLYDVSGIYTLGVQPKTVISENYIHDIYHPVYVHDPNHWFYLYTDEGSSGITVKNNYTEGEKFLQNANGPNNLWENNGPMVNDSIRQKAGLQHK